MTPSADTYARLTQALNWHAVDGDRLGWVMQAWRATPRHDVDWNDLPADVRTTVEAIERTPLIITPEQYVWHRLSDAIADHDSPPDVAQKIREAFDGVRTWDELPRDIQALVEDCERLPRTSWEDPFDAPDDTSYMDG